MRVGSMVKVWNKNLLILYFLTKTAVIQQYGHTVAAIGPDREACDLNFLSLRQGIE